MIFLGQKRQKNIFFALILKVFLRELCALRGEVVFAVELFMENWRLLFNANINLTPPPIITKITLFNTHP